ncbi:MAG: hypothetical protein NT023_07905 [Armatimonadetes bacterium]|nr:hypothetical protein [Armatimonadota bacterium]
MGKGGVEIQKPLVGAVIGGLTFSTAFTLLFAMLMYVAFTGTNKV